MVFGAEKEAPAFRMMLVLSIQQRSGVQRGNACLHYRKHRRAFGEHGESSGGSERIKRETVHPRQHVGRSPGLIVQQRRFRAGKA